MDHAPKARLITPHAKLTTAMTLLFLLIASLLSDISFSSFSIRAVYALCLWV